MPVPLADSDSEDELPPAWEERATNDGFVYYVNTASSHLSKTTQWTHPRTGKMKKVAGDLPIGWEKKLEESTGRMLFIDHQNKTTTYTDPRLAFAVEETPQNVSEVRQKFDASSTALQVLHGKDLSGKVAIITGSNVGIGFETAKSLAFHGCEIVMACRNEKSAQEAIEKIYKERPNAAKNCKFRMLDLSSLNSTKEFVDQIKLEYKHIDMLILNAGVFALPHTITEDGLEETFQISHLSHFYITISLQELLNHNSRVIVLSSESHRLANLPATGLTEQHLSVSSQKYWSMMAYNNAKLCNVLFVRELGKRWQDRGISVFAVHPGNMVSTYISRNWWFYRFLFAIVRPFTKSLQQAASTTVYCATANDLTGLTGYYFNNCYFCEPSSLGQNDQLAENLWTISEQLIDRILSKKQM